MYDKEDGKILQSSCNKLQIYTLLEYVFFKIIEIDDIMS